MWLQAAEAVPTLQHQHACLLHQLAQYQKGNGAISQQLLCCWVMCLSKNEHNVHVVKKHYFVYI